MPAKTITTIFLTTMCLLLTPLAQAHPGHPPTGVDHTALLLTVGLFSAVVLLLTIGITLRQRAIGRKSRPVAPD